MKVHLPSLKRFKQFCGREHMWADHYGALHVAAQYAGLELPLPYEFSGAWQHGSFGPWAQKIPSTLVYNLKPDHTLPLFVARADERECLQRAGYRNTPVIGMPILYVPMPEVARISRSLLVVPTHSLVGDTYPDKSKFEEYAEQIRQIASGFDYVAVCIHPNCRKNGLWIEEFTRCGFDLIDGAATDDANALVRMRALFSQFECVTTNDWGSHGVYALACGARVSIYGSPVEPRVENLLRDGTWRADPEALKKALSAEATQARRQYLARFYRPPADGLADVALGEWLLGKEHQLSPEGMRELLLQHIRPLPLPIAVAGDKTVRRQKILHLSAGDIIGGAARSAYRLHRALVEEGHDSTMLVRDRNSTDPRVVAIDAHYPKELQLRDQAEQKELIDSRRTALSNTYFNFNRRGYSVANHPLVAGADVINFHAVDGFISVEEIGRVLALGKPVVWTLHDQWALTGGCHYSAGCERYETGCHSCPQLTEDPQAWVARTFGAKLAGWNRDQLTVVTPSHWLGECSQRSALFRGRRHEVIPYGLVANPWRPIAGNVLRTKLNVPDDATILLFVAEQVSDRRKGWDEFRDALTQLVARHPKAAGKLWVMKVGRQVLGDFPAGVVYKDLGRIVDDRLLAAVYGSVDVFVLPTLEDNLPNTMLEAMACGTPVIGFDTGGVRDFVRPGDTGWLVPRGDVHALAEAIADAISHPDKTDRFGRRCIEVARAEFPSPLQAQRYAKLYAELAEKAAPAPAAVSGPILVTVITVVRNAAATIEKTLASVREQDYPQVEHLIVDAVSTDGTLELIARRADPRVKVISERDAGIYDGMNKGIRRSAGEILYFLNADDRLHDATVLSAVVRAFETQPNLDVVYTDHIGVNADGSHALSVKPCPVPAHWFERTNFCHQSMFFRRRSFVRHGFYELGFRMLADMHWNLRALTQGALFGYLPVRSCYFSNVGAHRQAAQAAIVAAEKERILTEWIRGKAATQFFTVPLLPAERTPPAGSGTRVLFLAHGPSQVNGPNIWLTRLLPALKERGFDPRVLFCMTGDARCSIMDRLIGAGVPCARIPYAYTEDLVRGIAIHIERERIDVLVPNLDVAAYFASAATKAAGVPTVGVIHSDDVFHQDLIEEFIAEKSGRHLSAAVVVSDFQYTALQAVNHGATRIVKAPCGAPVPAQVARHSRAPFRFVYVGRVVDEQKRTTDTVRAMIALLQRRPEAEFTICGDGTARPAVEALIAGAGMQKRIHLRGNLASTEVQAVLQESQAFVLLSDYEGIPIALMEAMAAGLVPVCTRMRSGISDLVRDGETGLLVDDRGPGFVAAAERLIDDAALWNTCSAAARRTIEEGFSTAANAETWARLLRELHAGAGPRRPLALPEQLDLPPVRSNPKGIAREDRRRPQSRPAMSSTAASHPFTNPSFELNNVDLYWGRSSILRAVREAAPLFEGTFLDIGCGVMPYREVIANAGSRITRYVGLDIETEIYNAKVDLRWDGKRIPLPDASVDSAMATEVLEHCPEPLAVLKEARRVLKPGGVFFFTVPYIWPLHDAPYDFFRYTPFALDKLLAEAGFADVKLQALGGWNASLAQMMGLWLKRAPMGAEERNKWARQLWPLYQELIKTDQIPSDPRAGNTMATGWTGVARVPAASTVALETSEVEQADLPVVLIRSHEFNYSETFIEDHVRHLSKNLTLLYGYPFPRFLKGGQSILSPTFEGKLKAVLEQSAGAQIGDVWREYTAGLTEFFKGCGARVALAESGLMGSFVHEACERAALPFVVHFHGVDAVGQELLSQWLSHYQRFFKTAAALVVVSQAMQAQLETLGAPTERIVLAPYGVAVELPVVAKPAAAGPRFVAVGRFVEKKGPQLTLQAFAAVRREVPAARLTMVGDGPLLASCRDWATANGLGDAVTFAGVQTREQVAQHMASSRVFVQHSLTAANGDSEGLPLAVLEAGAHGLPVVSTRHAGIPDAVREGVDGFLVDEKDVAGMAAAMLRLAREPELAAQLGESFRTRVRAEFSRRVSIGRLQALLSAAAGPAAPVAAESNDAFAAVANDRNDPAAHAALGHRFIEAGELAAAYCAFGEVHRLTGGTEETQQLLPALEANGALEDATVKSYRQRAGWTPTEKSTQPRRILIVTNLLPPQEMGGYGRTMWEFSRELIARGHAVRVLTADMPSLLRKPTPEHAALEPYVRRTLRLVAEWKDGGIVHESDANRRRDIVTRNHRTILAEAKEFAPDVAIAGNLDFVGHQFVQELLERGVPVLHRLGNAMPGYDVAHAPRSPLYCIAGCSEWVNEGIRAAGYSVERFAVLPPGSPLREYYRAFPTSREKLRIAFASLLMPYKGAHVLVEALAYLRRAGIDFECTLAGDSTSPDYVEKLKAVAQKNGFAEKLRLPGFLAKKELAALYSRTNVLVFPSVFEEPFGKTQVEAMAAGLLVISSGTGGSREIIRDGVTGLQFASSNARELAEKLAWVQANQDTAATIAAAGQEEAFRYTTEASVDRLEAILQELVVDAKLGKRAPALAAR